MHFLQLILVPLFLVQVFGQEQQIVLHSHFKGEGDSMKIDKDVNDLAKLTDKTFKSVTVTGAWIFYENPNYNPGGSGAVEQFSELNKSLFNFRDNPGVLFKPGSLRHVGNLEDARYPTMTFFEFKSFQGSSETSGDRMEIEQVEFPVQSLVITGKAEWRVTIGPLAQGPGWCLINNQEIPAWVADLEALLKPTVKDFPYDTPKSAKTDTECTEKDIVVKLN